MNVANLAECIVTLKLELPVLLKRMLGANEDKLKKIEWNSDFLANYSTSDSEEQILINTVKNTFSTEFATIESSSSLIDNKPQKRRIAW